VSVRLRQLAPIVLVLGLTVGGFFVSRAHGEQDARHDSAHRAEIAATEVRDRVAQAATLVDGVRRFLAGHISPGVTTEQFGDIGERWLGPVGVPAAAWVQRVSDYERPGYEQRTGHRIVEPTQSGGVRPPGPRESYLPATLVTGIPPMSVPGIDLSGASGVAAAVARPQTAYRVTATSLGKLPDGTAGLFLVQSAQRLENGGIVEPGFVVLFVPASWLLGAAADTVASSPTSSPKLKITVGSGSTGVLGGATAGSAFTALGQRFDLRVPVEKVRGNAAILPWIILTGGLALAALAGALAVISGRRAKARAEADRLFAISPDLIVVAGFDGYFKRVNPAFEALLGYTEQEALERPYIEFVHPDDRERTAAEARSLEGGQTTISFGNRYVCKDGTYRWIEWTATPVVEEQLIYAVARNVTERRQAEMNLREAEERNRALAEEQAALRRVATLVARRLPPEEVFAAVAQEVGQLLPVSSAAMGRYDPDGMFTTVAAWSTGMTAFPVGNRWTAEGKNVTTMVLETGGSARLDSFADASGPVGVAAREAGYRSAVGTPITVEGRLWGVMTAASTAEEPLPPDTETRLASFTELVATAIANAESRAGLARLAEQQAALRRVATLVAEGVPPAEVFSALCEQVNQLLDAQTSTIVRLEADGMTTVVASGGEITEELEVGTRTKPAPGMVVLPIIETGRPARKEDYDDPSGRPAGVARGLRVARALGIRSTVGVPITVEGALWGVFVIGTAREHFADETEERLKEFTELAATAIASTESRSEIARLAEDQAALRRVATLVAEGVSPAEVFSTLCDEVNRLLDAETTAIQRLEADGTVTIVASAGAIADQLGAGTRLTPQPGWVLTTTLETGRPARKEDYVQATGSIPAIIREVGIRSSVGAPIFVEGELWGVIIAGTVREHFPEDTEQRLEQFAGLAATAIANAEGRSELAASRVRIVTASDETRRRIERDLHDGTQQRLVTLAMHLRRAESTVPRELDETCRSIGQIASDVDRVIDELREIARGIHPAILSEGGLGPALRTLARRSALPVELGRVVDERLPEPIEVAAYYVISEALTNATKHAKASGVDIEAAAQNGSLRLSIRDDGVGGAEPAAGSGLLGLRDRVEALGGSIEIISPRGQGTHVIVELPLELDLSTDGGSGIEPTAAFRESSGRTSVSS
jgi:PAS domain S-box-containing protein